MYDKHYLKLSQRRNSETLVVLHLFICDILVPVTGQLSLATHGSNTGDAGRWARNM